MAIMFLDTLGHIRYTGVASANEDMGREVVRRAGHWTFGYERTIKSEVF